MLTLDIATAPSAVSKKWTNKKMTWDELVARLTNPTVSNITTAEYNKMAKGDKSKVKDVGGYVGGYLRGSRRTSSSVVHRQLVTLDVDFALKGFAEDFNLLFGNAAVIHTTFSHSEDKPRYRVIIPLDREVSCDEYMAIGRKIAGTIGIDLFDDTTFEPNRLMFWPAKASDGDFEVDVVEGEVLSADEVLESYVDWTDTTAWPSPALVQEQNKQRAALQADPLAKEGWVGAFCNAHDIHSAITTYLSAEYEQVDENRYTYSKGSTSGGLVVYDDKFAYSHHGTDPISGQMCNAFDLVRIHKYGHLDDNPLVRGNKRPSYAEMVKMCQNDKLVSEYNAKSRIREATVLFEDEYEEEAEVQENDDWISQLKTDKSGRILSEAFNIDLILTHDTMLRSRFLLNEFESKKYVKTPIPWRQKRGRNKMEPFLNVDYSGLRNYLEKVYSISSSMKIDDSLSLIAEQQRFHPVRDYLSSLSWDGTKRISQVLQRVFGVDDNSYTREALAKTMVGACARVFEPGCKFDLVLVLIGEQGTGKSTFFRKLGGEWFSDTFTEVQGTKAFEQIRGSWIIEIAELAALRKAEIESIKHFITKQVDDYRPAYGRERERYERQCVFVGTTNESQFLRDTTGNRRFMPVQVQIKKAQITPFMDEFEDIIPQLWAEAMDMYRKGESVYLSKEADRLANVIRTRHTIVDDRLGIVEDWLNTPVPENWNDMNTYDRQLYFDGEQRRGVVRDATTFLEVWVDCLGRSKAEIGGQDAVSVRSLLNSLPDWTKTTKQIDCGYGREVMYERIREEN